MLPDKMYAGIDIDNIRCKHLFEKLGFKLVGQTDDNDFLYYELEIKEQFNFYVNNKLPFKSLYFLSVYC